MKLLDFSKADCKLWRMPPLDFSKVENLIEKALVQAWQNGQSAQDALNSVMSNPGISDLTNQVKEALDYQREQRLNIVKEAYRKDEEETKKQEREKLESIAAKYKAEEEKVKLELEEAERKKQSVHASYNSAQEQLQKTRQEIYEKLKQVGGEEGLKTVLEINKVVTETKPRERKPGKLETTVKETLETQTAPTKREEITHAYAPANEYRRIPVYKRIISKINAILNYKLW